jgi:hypothetical protein
VSAFLLGTSAGRWILLGVAVALALGVIALLIYRQGEAAAAAAAAAVAIERTVAANKARAGVKPHDTEDMTRDPYNRDRSR